ncbi:MAG TPA: glycosyltransferase family 25 protein [Rhizomicrobium sp.]|nr:glycosyltransferase family 25 protein [Rhizomicrobium sp.]
MHIFLINLERRPDRLAAMTARAEGLGFALERVKAVDAAEVEPEALEHWFEDSGPLGEIPRGDKACLLSHRLAWQEFLGRGDSHAVFLEDDVVLSRAAGRLLTDDRWIPAGALVVKLEHYGPKGQRVLLTGLSTAKDGFQLGRILSRHTGAAAYVLSRPAAELLLSQTRFDLPVDHLLFNPNNSPLFARLAPLQLLPAIARQEQFVGVRSSSDTSDIEGTRKSLRALSATYVKRELVRFAHDLKLLPRQLAALAGGARFIAIRTDQPGGA